MKLVRNTGSERIIDLIRPWLAPTHQLDMATPELSLFAFGGILKEALGCGTCAFSYPPPAPIWRYSERAPTALSVTASDPGGWRSAWLNGCETRRSATRPRAVK